jgi:hypothetical protein
MGRCRDATINLGIPSEKVAVMAPWKKQMVTSRRKAGTRVKTRKPVKPKNGKAANRSHAKTTPRKRPIKAKRKRAAIKKAVPTVETVIANMIEEPLPGVTNVTEFVATGISGTDTNSEQLEERGATDVADGHRLQRPVDRLRDLINADRARCVRDTARRRNY